MSIPFTELAQGPTPLAFQWRPSPLLLTPAKTLQGGAALGVATEAMERATGRPTIWATAQYLNYAPGTEPIAVEVTIEVAGRNTTQARCVLQRDGVEILTAHAALGRRDFEFEGVWSTPPDVPPAEVCEQYRLFERGHGHLGDLAELRLARGRQVDELDARSGRGDGSFALWVRCWDGRHAVTAADLALIGDFMPLGFAEAAGRPVSGNSLDNTVRIGRLGAADWVLLAVEVQQIASGFGHGRAALWSEGGQLLGEVSQSVIMRRHSQILGAGRPANSAT